MVVWPCLPSAASSLRQQGVGFCVLGFRVQVQERSKAETPAAQAARFLQLRP